MNRPPAAVAPVVEADAVARTVRATPLAFDTSPAEIEMVFNAFGKVRKTVARAVISTRGSRIR